jgi:hypothetical protein
MTHNKSVLEKIATQVWGESNLENAKRIVIDYISNTNIKSKETIITNVNTITSKKRLDFYVANSLLKFEKLSV